MIRRLLLLSVALLLASAAPASAQEASTQAPAAQTEDLNFVVSLSLSPGACPPAKTRMVEMSDLVAHPEAYEGCLRVRGLASGRAAWPDVASLYRAFRPWSPDAPPPRLGLYGGKRLMKAVPAAARPVELTGLLGHCEGGLFMGGYCHDAGRGPYLILASVRTLPGAPVVRRTSPADRAAFGDLVDPQPGPGADAAQTALEVWRDQIRAGDVASFAKAEGYARATDLKSELARRDTALHRIFRDKASVFARLRAAPTTAPTRLFQQQTADRATQTYVGCVCLMDRCEGRWPIAGHDADNLPTRPYACTGIEPSGDRLQTFTDVAYRGLAEPR